MNNRGKPLTTLEKLKNRLIYLTEKLPGQPEDRSNLRKKIDAAWGQIYSCLAQNPQLVLDEDVFLSAHLSLYRKPKEAVFSEKEAEEKLFKMFCNRTEKFSKDESLEREDIVSYRKVEDYIIKLAAAAPNWYKIHNSKTSVVKKILLLNNSKELKVFLLALFLNDEENKVNEILFNLERILFRNRIPSMVVFDERSLASWARDIYLEEDTWQGINQKIKKYILTPISNQNLIQSLNTLFNYERGKKGFHRWGTLKYFLFEYEENLKIKCRETKNKVSVDDYESTTIEHIIPQQFSDNWLESVNEFTLGMDSNKTGLAHKVLLNTLVDLQQKSGQLVKLQ